MSAANEVLMQAFAVLMATHVGTSNTNKATLIIKLQEIISYYPGY